MRKIKNSRIKFLVLLIILFLFSSLSFITIGCNDNNKQEFEIVEGDMAFNSTTIDGESRGFTGTLAGGILLWGDVIPYVFEETSDGNPTNEEKVVIRKAMDEWQKNCGVYFYEEDYEKLKEVPGLSLFYYVIRINNDILGAGLSTVGRQIGSFLEYKKTPDMDSLYGTILHELGHCLGLYHEHQRYDRDKYITVNTSALTEEWKDAYDMKAESETYTYHSKCLKCTKKVLGKCLWWKIYDCSGTIDIAISKTLTPYDFESIMHYNCYNSGVQVITPNLEYIPDGETSVSMCSDIIGQRKKLSYYDIQSVQILYGFPCDKRPCMDDSCLKRYDDIYGTDHCGGSCE